MTVSGPDRPGEPPPTVPPEYAEAYRRGYERAFREAVGDGPEPEPAAGVGGVPRAASTRQQPPVPEAEPAEEPVRTGPAHRDDSHDHRSGRPGWLVPVLLAGLVVLLLLTAYGLGRVFSSTVGSAGTEPENPDGVVLSEDGETEAPGSGGDDEGDEGDDGDADPEEQQPEKGAYQGRTQTAGFGGASASCRAPSSVDAAGNPVSYPATNVYDGDLTTAWRCNGDGVGQSITLTLSDEVEIGEVGIVPGYAKTDPSSGVDRYAENNRLTRVRWIFSDGSEVVQKLDGSPGNRDLQTRRIVPTTSDSVVLEVLDSVRGERNTIAVSEVRVGRTTG
jgi:hypothetical protein